LAVYYCFANKKIPRHLVIAIGNAAYLMLPTKPICEGHCLIVPLLHHSGGTVAMENDLLEEVLKFMKSLTKMNYKNKSGSIFLETVINLHHENHTFIECIPVHEDIAANAPIFFKKAILESESEWAQHKKLIDTGNKGVRKCIPPRFPYFSVQFGMTQGMAHVIENEKKISPNFWSRSYCRNSPKRHLFHYWTTIEKNKGRRNRNGQEISSKMVEV